MLAVVAAACAPTGGGGASQPAAPAEPAVKRVVTLADSYEPKAITETFLGQQSSGNNVRQIVQDGLVKNPQYQLYEPQLAEEIPSIAKGTWKVNPDRTMETTWRLRPNIKWHDGQPFTSADLLFTHEIGRDTEIAGVTAASASGKLMDSVSAPDPLTFVVHWSAPFVTADLTGVGDILPKHLTEDMYRKDKQSLVNSPLLSTEFVGLGPYRMVHWEQG